MNLTEEEVIELSKQGNTLAQRKLYDTYSKKLYGISLRYANSEEEAADILQDSFIKIFTKLDTYKFEGSFEGWMRRITTHTAIEYYRKRIEYSEIGNVETNINLSTTEDLSLEEDDILKLIQNMPNGYRMVFNMYAIEGYSHQEIALMLKISEGTSKSQLARARQYLQREIAKNNRINIQNIQPLIIILRLLYENGI
jgi:RNA polymerase sigma factor (sigma-70 family)